MIAICSDHAGYELKSIIEGYLDANNREFEDFGTFSSDSCDYPDFAHPCAQAVESGKCYPGIAMCGSGNGIAMTLNKHKGIRAALCWTTELAALARQHNDANVLVLPARFIRRPPAAIRSQHGSIRKSVRSARDSSPARDREITRDREII